MGRAREAGIDPAEVYAVTGESFECQAVHGDIGKYSVNTSLGLSLRGIYQGKMGCAATEALDEEAIEQLIVGVKESALWLEDEDAQDIYPGAENYPMIETYAPELDEVSAEEKLAAALALEKATLAADPRIKSIISCEVATETDQVRLVNSYGLNLTRRDNVAVMVSYGVAQEGESKSADGKVIWSRRFTDLDPERLGEEAAMVALNGLNAAPVKSGRYRTIILNEAMSSLLATFSGIFSAEEAQQGLSLLKGREGESIASQQVTLVDDPLLPGGLASRSFDAEGMPAQTKKIIDKGVLTTLLHNRKTAQKQGVASTGNASKGGYAAPVRVAPTNLFLQPGIKTLPELMSQMGRGLVITDLSGLHSGADPISGDFSLLAKGYEVTDGQRGPAVEQITIAGNFYELLKNVREIGSDLLFPARSIGSPSVDIGEIAVAGI
ncbi:MAG: TldD/PmbA family protein, partial [Clostridia bacterium]|nr:TldD/PmbA family protein [Clostridia bacterium]